MHVVAILAGSMSSRGAHVLAMPARPLQRFEPPRTRIAAAAAALAMTALTALLLVVVPAVATSPDPGSTMLATPGRAARTAFDSL